MKLFSHIYTRVGVVYLVSVVLPIILVATTLTFTFDNITIESNLESRKESSEQLSYNFDDLVGQYTQMVNKVSFDQRLSGYLNPNRKYTPVEAMDAYRNYLTPILQYVTEASLGTLSFHVYYSNPNLPENYLNYHYINDTVKESKLYQKAIGNLDQTVINYQDGKIYVIRAVSMLNSDKLSFIVSLEIPKREFERKMMAYENSQTLIFLMDGKNEMVISNHVAADMPISTDSVIAGLKENTEFDLHQNREDYKVWSIDCEGMPSEPAWKLVTVLPLKDIQEKRSSTLQVMLIEIVIVLPCSSVLFFILLHNIVFRIKKLTAKMNLAQQGQLNLIEISLPNDEISQMMTSYNSMITSIETLMKENFESSVRLKNITISKQKAELYGLESQINPHFMFNTLENIRMNLLVSDNYQLASIIERLANIMRRSLNYSVDLIPFSEELSYVKDYLEIQAFRFGDKFRYEMFIPEEAKKCFIPKLTVQSVVENAVVHGIERISSNGVITISAVVQEDVLTITVEDNGIGIEESRLLDLIEDLYENPGIPSDHIGLKNVHERIKLHYGQQYGIQIMSEYEVGTTVKLTFPASKNENAAET